MTDYKAEAEKVESAWLEDRRPLIDLIDHIAAALEAAEKRGYAAGLREAADIAEAFAAGRWRRHDEGQVTQGWVGTGAGIVAGKARRRAEEVERS